MNSLSGGCHCGAVRVQLTLPGAPSDYAPRACDCSFCHKHGAAFVSDPAGALRIEAGRAADLVHYRQGSGQAECLCCAHCGVFVAVVSRLDGRLYGTANVRALDGDPGFAASVTVSPRLLGAEDKRGRWQANWCGEVTLGYVEGGG